MSKPFDFNALYFEEEPTTEWFNLNWFKRIDNKGIVNSILNFGAIVSQYLDLDQYRVTRSADFFSLWKKKEDGKYGLMRRLARQDDCMHLGLQQAIHDPFCYAVAIKFQYLEFTALNKCSNWIKNGNLRYCLVEKVHDDFSKELKVKIADNYGNRITVSLDKIFVLAADAAQAKQDYITGKFKRKEKTLEEIVNKLPLQNSDNVKNSGDV